MSDTDAERNLRKRQMEADIRNKDADTEYKKGLLRYEPWKVVAVSAGAGAGLLAAAVAILGALVRLFGAGHG